ncbi:hypothetical protein GXP70_12355 [Paenibacillus lycopersici]|uniref:Uncharacterized protein n=1 Tax=Paenibacillus lycopersici TaxID=2704462 RepID=A0A6C0FX78_9BACL|nr:hypothetical protein [Paenibacillus lycopersici]QHT60652.1 hypothetical protein GXP70_12355 [Paenibacillus lycopersici]
MQKAFTTTLEAVSSNKTKTTIKLSMSNAAARQFSALYLNSINKELLVSFDDPQMQMDLQPAPNGRPGVVATIDNGGVVDAVAQADEDEDEDELNDLAEEELDFGMEPEEEHEGEADGEEEQEDGSAADEHDPADESAADASEAEAEAEIEVSKEELEEFILDVRPAFTDIPYDFPQILERKRESGSTWMEIARQLNQPSSRVQSSFNIYKKRVKKMIAEQNDNGAA